LHAHKNCEFEVKATGIQFHDWDEVSHSFTIFRQQLPQLVNQDIWATGLDMHVQLFHGPHQFSFLNSDDKQARAAIDRLLAS
jgi:hypothetical protein